MIVILWSRVLGFAAALFFLLCGLLAMEAAASLPHDAYIWQRAWNQPLRTALAQHGSSFSNLVALSAEVSWKEKLPRVTRVPIDYSALTNVSTRAGLVLRIGPYPGPFVATDRTALFLADLAASLVAEGRANQLTPSELQIDFDCAESKLEGYRLWLEAIRRKIPNVPLTITALPSWLNQAAFKSLISATDGYVLQVHSLERPTSIDAPFTLCDPAAARRAVERAGSFNVPFRVALPTYSYLLAFDDRGRLVGLSAEGPRKGWLPNVRLREAAANAIEIASLVQGWTANHPIAMRGIIWYRFPNSEDTFNWRWPTLGAILAARIPRESFRTETRRVEPGLVEINLVNDGELDISSRLAIEVRWSRDGGTRLVAGDGLRGFELVEDGPSTIQFQNKTQPCRLKAGEKLVIGWLRLSEEREVQIETKKL